MNALTGRRILLVAPDRWGVMRVAKQNYAIELARRNEVVYLESPDANLSTAFQSRTVEIDGASVRVVRYRPWLPLSLRFHVGPVHDLMTSARVRRLMRTLRFRPDVVISFDAGLLHTDLDAFGAPQTLFMPMDRTSDRALPTMLRSCRAIATVSPVIAAPIEALGRRVTLLDHGLAAPFARAAAERLEGRRPFRPVREARVALGYVGNLLMGPVLDREAIRASIAMLPEVDFHFWSPTTRSESNVGGSGTDVELRFIEWLRAQPNVALHGPVSPDAIVDQLEAMDAFFVCYDVRFDPNRCSNSHKVIEYLSTGRPVFSTHLSMYRDRSGLLEMLPNFDNRPFPSFLRDGLARLDALADAARHRVAYALDRTYARQVEQLARILTNAT